MKLNYNNTFELMKIYSKLGETERKVIEYLFELETFEGNYSQLARAVNIDVSDLTHSLKYLNALGLVYIGYKQEIKKFKIMTTCFLVYGWLETLHHQYNNGNIVYSINDKIKFYKEKLN